MHAAGITRALAAFLGAGVLTFGVVAPPEHCPTVTVAELRSSATLAVDWLVANQHPDGSYLYEYRLDTDSVVDDYNVVRHAGVVMSLYMASDYGIERASDAADRGVAWARSRLTVSEDWAAVGGSPGQPSVGATALLAAGLSIRRDVTADESYDALMTSLGQFLLGQVEPSGAVSAEYDMDAGRPVAGAYSKYYTGEVYWAIVHLARQFPDGPWGAAGDRIGRYIAEDRDAAEDMGRVRDHWAAYGLSETTASGDPAHDRPLTAAEAAYARHQSEILGAIVRWLSQQQGPWGTLVRGPSVSRGGAYGTIGEALTRQWRAADADPQLSDIRDPLGWRALCLSTITIDTQSTADDAAGTPSPERVRGAWFFDGTTRMDDQQHALSSLLQSIDIVEAGAPSAAEGSGGPSPSMLVWVVALMAALNPVRLARVLAGRRPDTRATAIGVATMLAAALLSGPLLRALDVSAPAFRLAAGLLGVIAGGVAMFRTGRPRSGLIAAVLTVPVVAMSIGAGTDRGVLVVAIAIVAAAALTALAVRIGGANRWVEGAVDGLLVVFSVLLIVAGVMAV